MRPGRVTSYDGISRMLSTSLGQLTEHACWGQSGIACVYKTLMKQHGIGRIKALDQASIDIQF